MASDDKKLPTIAITTRPRTSSSDSSAPSIKTPRIARFAEATAVHSPTEPTQQSRLPFREPPMNHYKPQPQPSDIGFGYISDNRASSHVDYKGQEVEIEETDAKYLPPSSPLKSPLKSALKSPGAAPRRFDNPLSPTFREEQILEKHEEATEKEQAKDLKAKFRVRSAKLVLRGINFSCSLIVLSMLTATFAIFNATKALPPRNNLPPWAANTKTWPQITLLVIACISLVMSIVIFWAYFRGGHRRAEKVAVYYTSFAVAFFIFSIVMWGVGAGILNQSKAQGEGKDLWGWSCKDNRRKQLFQEHVSYDLVCRLQNWSLICCIIEVVVETFTIAIYAIVFYRYYSKRQLRKSMAVRDRARSDLYLAQLRSQSAPNTPGFGPLSPRDGGWRPPPGYVPPASSSYNGSGSVNKDPLAAAEEGEAQDGVQYPRAFAQPKPFTLQAPPVKGHNATSKAAAAATAQQGGVVEQVARSSSSSSPVMPSSPMFAPAPVPVERLNEHVPAAPGEQQYDAVPIPGAYASPLSSPGFAPQGMRGFDFGVGVGVGGEERERERG